MSLPKLTAILITFFHISITTAPHTIASEITDMTGSHDFEGLPRVEGTYIAGYRYGEFDTGNFLKTLDGRTPAFAQPEGKRTRIMYIGGESQTSVQLLRNYQRAFADFGDYQERYACQAAACWPSLARNLIWSEANRIPVSFRNAYSLYNLGGNQQSPGYVYGTIRKDDRLLHVSAFTTFITQSGTTAIRNVPVAHIEIVEIEDFEPTLVFVKADEMIRAIADEGSIALYGIQFELDSAAITPTSSATIDEIAKALQTEAGFSVYVVGHTDGTGALVHNQKLSQARADAVVDALTSAHGISPDRLTAIGVGPVAPMASNDSEEGRGLNRRVQIVKR